MSAFACSAYLLEFLGDVDSEFLMGLLWLVNLYEAVHSLRLKYVIASSDEGFTDFLNFLNLTLLRLGR